ncbi:hypothetical protein ACFFLS_04830 [Flavobacterium procerum]|uniref:Uncharacterized protein n=1 Tax=Flavobacterium procerum TaxID=1455569 RepID=A0ABV6BLP7_9FLAO
MKSGKQILLHLLTEYSQKFQDKDVIEEVSDRLKAGLLLHGSTPQFMFEYVEKCGWLTKHNIVDDENRGTEKQGLGLKKQELLFSDLFSLITDDETTIPDLIKNTYPDMTLEDYQAGVHMIWLLLRLLEWHVSLETLETEEPDIKIAEKSITSYQQILNEYRKDPDNYF